MSKVQLKPAHIFTLTKDLRGADKSKFDTLDQVLDFGKLVKKLDSSIEELTLASTDLQKQMNELTKEYQKKGKDLEDDKKVKGKEAKKEKLATEYREKHDAIMALDRQLGERYNAEMEIDLTEDEKALLTKVIKNNFKTLTIPVDNLETIVEVLK